MSDIGAQSSAYDAVPSGQVHLVELRLDDLSDVIEHATLLEGESHTVDGVLLHRLVHIS